MSEAVYAPAAKSFSFPRAVVAGFIATILITISLALFGMNLMKMLGGMMLPDASPAAQYVVGGLVHLMIGLFYGIVYGWLFGKVSEWNPLLKGTVFGLAIAAIALAVMPIMSAMMGGGGAATPCSPCAAKKAAATPCNPCAPKQAATPCNPCGAKRSATPCNPCAPKQAVNPCNPCSAKQAINPCNLCAAKQPANPCNPCGGGQGPYSGLVSVINHLIYGIALALVYRSRPA